ncbi:MAG: hypothetical protein U0230_28030 [Polyangiales bacterium]
MIQIEKHEDVFRVVDGWRPGDSIVGDWRVKAVAKSGYTMDRLLSVDYLDSMPTYPIFSAKFVERIGDWLVGDMSFVPVDVVCGSEVIVFYLGIVKRRVELIDRVRSEFRVLGGAKIPWKIVVSAPAFGGSLIAKDCDYSGFYVTVVSHAIPPRIPHAPS